MKKLILFLVCLGSFNISISQVLDDQDPAIRVVPPSPEAASLGKFGTLPVGLYTGSAQFSVPLYTVQGNNLSVPITLNYGTNGIKFEDISTWVGAGWTLEAGGLITRTVRGEADEKHAQEGIPELNSSCILYDEARLFETDISDLEYDLFSYNFLGYSGSFIIKNNEVIPIEKSDLIFGTVSTSMNRFLITDGQGTKYYFGVSEWGSDSGNPIEFTRVNNGTSIKTAWYITKIEHYTGESMYFDYDVEEDVFHYASDYSQVRKLGISEMQRHPDAIIYDPYFPCLQCDNISTNVTFPITFNTNKHNAVYLKSIFNYNQTDKVEFIKSDRTAGVGNYNMLKKLTNINGRTKKIKLDISEATFYRLYLNSIKINSFQNTENEIYSFDYNKTADNWTPSRSGYYRDYWGYYNGATTNTSLAFGNHEANPNSNITGHGVLKKITYPTKGYTIINYEPNSINLGGGTPGNCHDVYVPWAVGAHIYGVTAPGYLYEYPFVINHDQDVVFEFQGEYFPNLNPNINGLTVGNAIFTIVNTNTGEVFGNESLHGNGVKIISANLPEGNYIVNYTVKSDIFHVKFKFYICDEYLYGVPLTELTGGVRVRQTDTYSENNVLAFSKRYNYEDEKVARPIKTIYSYQITSFAEFSCTNGSPGISSSYIFPYCVFANRLSSPLFTDNQSAFPCFYGRVTEKLVNSSGQIKSEVLHKFKGSGISSPPLKIFNHTDQLTSGKYGNPPAFYNPSGQPFEYQTLEYEHVNGQVRVVKNTTFNYDFLSDSVDLYPSYLVDRITQVRGALISQVYNSNGVQCVSNDAIEFELNGWRYFYVSALRTLKSKVVKDTFYPENYNPNIHNEKNVVNTTNFFYENPAHKQLTKIENDTSEKILGVFNQTKKEVTKYYYPSDITNPNPLMSPFSGGAFTTSQMQGLTELVSRNFKIRPVQVEKYSLNNELISINRTCYKHFPFTDPATQIVTSQVFPEKIQTLKAGIGNTNTLEDKIIYNKYSRFGDVIEMKNAFGRPVSYIYGYQKRYVIGILENLTYNDLTPYMSEMEDVSYYTDNNNSNDLFDTLRNDFPNAQITSFLYNPLVGITAKKDPKGLLFQYTYDAFNRLQFIHDENKNIIKEINYHYRP